MDYRAGESKSTVYRSERFYCVNGQWFFSTREGIEMGPFESHKDAEGELLLFIRHTHDNGFIDAVRADLELSEAVRNS